MDFLDLSTDFVQPIEMTKPTVKSILQNAKSGLGLDIAKNHSGITVWENQEVKTYGFKLIPVDETDYHAIYRLRKDFKTKLKEIVAGKHFEYCIVEDVYGGENFDTIRKLAELNTVIDELIDEEVCTVDNFVRWNEPKWLSKFRILYKQAGRPTAKLETQGILDYLEFDFYKQNKDTTNTYKESIFFEDICDSCAMLLALIISDVMGIDTTKTKKLTMSEIKYKYINHLDDRYLLRDKNYKENLTEVTLPSRSIEESMKTLVAEYPDKVLVVTLPPSKLGRFGIDHKLKFYTDNEGYLLFYKKGLETNGL